jgi:hypothetical protein
MAAHVRANFQNETHQFGRHHRFFQQLNGYNLPSHWQKVDANVLALWGKGDFVSAGEDHAAIAEIVNAARPGKGVYKALDGIDHGFTRAASQLESIQRQGPGEFNPLIISTLRELADGLR